MSYFRELPDLEYVSPFRDKTSNTDYIKSKNIFKRVKLREDIANNVTVFNRYVIEDNERPDQVAKKVYNDENLDWVILTTNNITNVNEQWPLDNNTLHNYMLEKYGSEEEIYAIHHYETNNIIDNYGRVVLPEGLITDKSFESPEAFTTVEGVSEYPLSAFPSSNDKLTVSINLNQVLILTRNQNDFSIPVDTYIDTSKITIYGRDLEVTVNIFNTFNDWPSSWGGIINVNARSGTLAVVVDDIAGTKEIEIPDTLYKIIGVDVNGKIVPTFIFVRGTPV